MKKYLFSLIVFGLLIFPVLALAQRVTGPPRLDAYDLLRVLARLVSWLYTILITVCVAFLVIAGFYFVTAQGDIEKVSKARRFVIYALIGLAIGTAAYGLVALVGEILDVEFDIFDLF